MKAFLFLVGFAAGCSGAQQRAEQALVVGTYERQLDQCREKGKVSGSYAVYEACARAVDRTLCATKGLMCTDGGE